MKKIKIILSLIITLLLTFSNTYAIENSTSSTDSGYKEVIIDNNLNFKAFRDGAIVKMLWTKYSGSDFQYYKLIRSETLENPVYPDNGYIKAIGNVNEVEAKVENTSEKSAVYRICVITTNKDRYCSKTVKLDGYVKNTNNNSYTGTSTSQTTSNQISETLKKGADQLVATFAINIDKKFSNSSDKIKAYESIISKLEELKKNKPNLTNLIYYIIVQLKQKMNRYNDDLSDIEKIFQEAQ